MKARGKRVAVKKLDLGEAQTEGGLHLPGGMEALGRPPIGVVVAVGALVKSEEWCESCGAPPGEVCLPSWTQGRECRERPQAIAQGDLVLYHRHGGTEMTLDGVEFVVLHEDEVLMHFDGEELGDTKAVRVVPGEE